MMTEFKGLAWNCGGLRSGTPLSHEKVLYFEKQFQNVFDVAFFLETHHKTEEEIPLYKNTNHILHSTVDKDDSHTGIIGLIKKDYKIVDSSHLIQGRILNIQLQHKTNKTEYNISALYLDTNNHLTKTKIENIVSKLKKQNKDHLNNIFLGDFNFIDHEKDKANGMNNIDRLVYKVWHPFISELDMVDPYREQNPNRRIWSFIGTGKAGNSRIDRLYVNTVTEKSCRISDKNNS